eukprot:Tamp_26412.p2 GENE.Tamp_26412~~Tamp_26412.p2  ORF type:complete len:104 (-),score=10.12 Tamp_26412:586-897(-)
MASSLSDKEQQQLDTDKVRCRKCPRGGMAWHRAALRVAGAPLPAPCPPLRVPRALCGQAPRSDVWAAEEKCGAAWHQPGAGLTRGALRYARSCVCGRAEKNPV